MNGQLDKLSFTGHETFPFRYPWPAKGVRGVLDDGGLFGHDDAFVTLGVGKNMVRSIRHWCETLGLIERIAINSIDMKATDLGLFLFGPEGWDPFIEYPGTPWLLHWMLVRSRDRASAWYLLFTQYSGNQFTRDELTMWLSGIARQAETRATEASIKRDVNVLIRTYVPSRVSRNLPKEETFDSPLVQLGLINEIENGVFSFSRGMKPSLPDEVFLYALLDYWRNQAEGSLSMSFEKALYGPGSPGATFKLSSNACAEILERIAENHGIRLDETAGMRTIFSDSGSLMTDTRNILAGYYSATMLEEVAA